MKLQAAHQLFHFQLAMSSIFSRDRKTVRVKNVCKLFRTWIECIIINDILSLSPSPSMLSGTVNWVSFYLHNDRAHFSLQRSVDAFSRVLRGTKCAVPLGLNRLYESFGQVDEWRVVKMIAALAAVTTHRLPLFCEMNSSSIWLMSMSRHVEALSSLLAAPSHPSIPYLHKIKQKQSTHDVLGWQWDRNKNKIKTSSPKRSQRDRSERKFTIIGWKCCVVRARKESLRRELATRNTRSTNSATSRQTRDFVAHVDESTSEQRREVKRKEKNWLSRIRTRSSYAFNTGTMLHFTPYILYIYNPFFHSLVVLSFITLHNFNVVQFKWE